MSALSLWGLDDTAEALYRTMLRNPSVDRAEALAGHMGLDTAQVEEALRALARAGLVDTHGDTVHAAPPSSALSKLVHDELRSLEERRAQVDAVRGELAGFAADHTLGQSHSWATLPFEVFSLDEAVSLVEDLQRSTTGEVLSCHQARRVELNSTAFNRLVEAQLREGRPMRGLYPLEILEDPRRHGWALEWLRAGERVRLVTKPMPSMAIFGDEYALVASPEGPPGGDLILVRAPALIGISRLLFDLAWNTAIPLEDPEQPGSSDHRRLLELLALGVKDEAIARHFDVSLRTVRRRVAELLAELGVESRFQAGLEGARRGLL